MKFIIEVYWEPSDLGYGIWSRSEIYPGEYEEATADSIVEQNWDYAYRKREVK
jgi:hypothetical protein